MESGQWKMEREGLQKVPGESMLWRLESVCGMTFTIMQRQKSAASLYVGKRIPAAFGIPGASPTKPGIRPPCPPFLGTKDCLSIRDSQPGLGIASIPTGPPQPRSGSPPGWKLLAPWQAAVSLQSASERHKR
ncbi:hypothetical protein EJ110_NYTH32318 [Nymphaea thermarum]|nr:hypothetical protein EJ110_NYTH32318 [Nymphaea thermarum]